MRNENLNLEEELRRPGLTAARRAYLLGNTPPPTRAVRPEQTVAQARAALRADREAQERASARERAELEQQANALLAEDGQLPYFSAALRPVPAPYFRAAHRATEALTARGTSVEEGGVREPTYTPNTLELREVNTSAFGRVHTAGQFSRALDALEAELSNREPYTLNESWARATTYAADLLTEEGRALRAAVRASHLARRNAARPTGASAARTAARRAQTRADLEALRASYQTA